MTALYTVATIAGVVLMVNAVAGVALLAHYRLTNRRRARASVAFDVAWEQTARMLGARGGAR